MAGFPRFKVLRERNNNAGVPVTDELAVIHNYVVEDGVFIGKNYDGTVVIINTKQVLSITLDPLY